MSRKWIQRDYQKLWLTGNLKERINKAITEEIGKMGYIQL
jgi:CO dehydrogenase/acetyl-CoA synthase beta subunit